MYRLSVVVPVFNEVEAIPELFERLVISCVEHAPFEIPAEIYAGWNARDKGASAEQAWEQSMAAYTEAHPQLAADVSDRCRRT